MLCCSCLCHPKQDQQTTAENTHALVKELVEVGMKGPLSTQQQAQHGLGCLRVQTPLVLLLKGTRGHCRSKLIHSAPYHQTLATWFLTTSFKQSEQSLSKLTNHIQKQIQYKSLFHFLLQVKARHCFSVYNDRCFLTVKVVITVSLTLVMGKRKKNVKLLKRYFSNFA